MVTKEEMQNDKLFQNYKKKFTTQVIPGQGWFFSTSGQPLGSCEEELYSHFQKLVELAKTELKTENK